MSPSLPLYSLTTINCPYALAKENFKILQWKQQLNAQTVETRVFGYKQRQNCPS